MPVGSRRSQVPLADRTAFRIGGVAAYFLELACDIDAVSSIAAQLREPDCFMLGGGTNVLVADSGYNGTIVQFDRRARLEPLGRGRYRVSANASLDGVISQVCGAGFYGVERLAGIPGSVGGAVVQNAGAYDQQLADVIESVLCVNCATGEVEKLSVDDCHMSYRDSTFKRSPGSRVIVECTVELNEEQPPQPNLPELVAELERRGVNHRDASAESVADAVRAIRARKDHLLEPTNPSAGSFFKNPRFAADDPRAQAVVRRFIERRDCLAANGADWIGPKANVVRTPKNGQVELIAGLLIATANDPSNPESAYSPGRAIGALRLGAAGANTIVNAAEASAADVVALARQMRHAVSGAYGLTLLPEVVLVGDVSLE